MENLKYGYNLVNDWIKTADQKAMVLGSFNIAAFVFQLVSFKDFKCWGSLTVLLFVLFIISTVVAMFYWLKIIYPSLDNKHKKSKLYFQHIANAYSNDIDLGITEIVNLSEESIKRDLASQIVINSIIAKKKYEYVQTFIWGKRGQVPFSHRLYK
jgi:hypothetical protein